jgi:hypothetical protein
MPQNKPKSSTAAERANEALDRIAPEGKAPALKALDFLLQGSHDEPQKEGATTPHHSPPLPTTPPNSQPVLKPHAPDKDFNRRANSLERDAMPAGLFPGSTFKVYNALYLRSRGAVVPRRKVRASRRDFIDWTDIRNIKTIDSHLRYLMAKGLIVRAWELGSTEGSEYEVFLPEEVLPPLPTTPHHSPPLPTTQKTSSGNTQKLGSGGDSQTVDFQTTSGDDKTELRLDRKIVDDDAALAGLFRELEKEIIGKNSASIEQWREVKEVLLTELRIASGRTTVSNVPTFLAEHLRRRLWKVDKKRAIEIATVEPEQGSQPAFSDEAKRSCPDCAGTNFWYPDGPDKGVAKCRHTKLIDTPTEKQ